MKSPLRGTVLIVLDPKLPRGVRVVDKFAFLFFRAARAATQTRDRVHRQTVNTASITSNCSAEVSGPPRGLVAHRRAPKSSICSRRSTLTSPTVVAAFRDRGRHEAFTSSSTAAGASARDHDALNAMIEPLRSARSGMASDRVEKDERWNCCLLREGSTRTSDIEAVDAAPFLHLHHAPPTGDLTPRATSLKLRFHRQVHVLAEDVAGVLRSFGLSLGAIWDQFE